LERISAPLRMKKCTCCPAPQHECERVDPRALGYRPLRVRVRANPFKKKLAHHFERISAPFRMKKCTCCPAPQHYFYKRL